MALKKIKDADLEGKGIIPLPSRPNIGAKPLQTRFDQLPREVIIPRFNENVEEQEPINRQVPIAYETAKAAKAESSEAWFVSKKALAATEEGGGYVFGPATGNYITVQDAFNELYDLLRESGVTAEEYAAYELTAEQYAAYQMTAREYSMRAKIILGG